MARIFDLQVFGGGRTRIASKEETHGEDETRLAPVTNSAHSRRCILTAVQAIAASPIQTVIKQEERQCKYVHTSMMLTLNPDIRWDQCVRTQRSLY